MSKKHIDGVFRTRSLGIAAVGIPDQYAEGTAAKVWKKYIGDQQSRTSFYREKLTGILKEHNVKSLLDVACGTGYIYTKLNTNSLEYHFYDFLIWLDVCICDN